jgi:hypothetical protein
MENDNSTVVKIGYYILFVILIIIIISIIVILYGYIHKRHIGTAFDTHLENALISTNMLLPRTPDIYNIIYPSFIEVYRKNVSNETELLKSKKYGKYIVSIDKTEIFGLKFLGLALFIILLSLKYQEHIEDFTNHLSSRLNNLNVLIIAIIVIILFAIVTSGYLFIKFTKMRKILSVTDESDYDTDLLNDLLLLKQGLLYQPLTNVKDKIDYSKLEEMIVDFNTTIDTEIESISDKDKHAAIKKDNLTKKKIILELPLSSTTLADFYTKNGGKSGSLPAPFNGGDNKYEKIYKNTANIGTLISGSSLLVSIISLIIIYKRAE